MSEEAIKKRKERESKKAAGAKAADGSSIFTPAETAAAAPPNSSDVLYTVTIPASSTSFEWYSDSACLYTSIEAAKAGRIWEYPSTLHERAKCGVFRGLWEQGMFMGGGIKFGGDYLVYPGWSVHLNFLLALTCLCRRSSPVPRAFFCFCARVADIFSDAHGNSGAWSIRDCYQKVASPLRVG
jgi:hypothetical protein